MDVDMSEGDLRQRLIYCALEAGDKKVADVSYKNCLWTITSNIAKSEKREKIIRRFFRCFPSGEEISNNILKIADWQIPIELKIPLGYTISEQVLFHDGYFENVKKICKILTCDELYETLRLYDGLRGILRLVREGIIPAYKHKDEDSLKKVLESVKQDKVIEALKAYQGHKKLGKVAGTIGSCAYFFENKDVVASVAETFLNSIDSKQRLEKAIQDIRNHAYQQNLEGVVNSTRKYLH